MIDKDRKIIVLHINTFDKGGGAEKFCMDFVINSGVENYLLVKDKTTNYDFVDFINKYSINNFLVIIDKILWKLHFRKLSICRLYIKFKKQYSFTEQLNCTYYNLKKHPFYRKANIIHLHNIHGNYFDLNSLIKIAKEKKIIWSLHDMWAFTGGEAFVLENENYKIGKGETPYNIYYPLSNPKIDKRNYNLKKKKKIYKKICENIYFITGSLWLTDCFKSSYVYNNKLNVQLIPEGINVKQFYNRRERSWDIPRILIVNVKNYYKGTEILQNIFLKTKSVFEIDVIGNDISINYNNYQVHYKSYVTSDDALCELFNRIDILIFPSLQDNCPLMVSCAMACGVCVLATETSGLINQLENGAGLLFKYNDENDLIEKIEYAARDLNNTRNIGIIAEERAKNIFNSELMYEEYKRLYKEVIS